MANEEKDISNLKPIVELTEAEKAAIDAEIDAQVDAYSESFLNAKALYDEVKALRQELVDWGIDERKKYIEDAVKERVDRIIKTGGYTIAEANVAPVPEKLGTSETASESEPVVETEVKPVIPPVQPVQPVPVVSDAEPEIPKPEHADSEAEPEIPKPEPIVAKKPAPQGNKKSGSVGFVITLIILLLGAVAFLGYLVDVGAIGSNAGFLSELFS
ncbi:MAG: hypothetical protein LBN34_01160 [Clostridiales Family XIII bacterium]|nr:hypothetical protein [Clostridiales Family XIII bacterium]